MPCFRFDFASRGDRYNSSLGGRQSSWSPDQRTQSNDIRIAVSTFDRLSGQDFRRLPLPTIFGLWHYCVTDTLINTYIQFGRSG